MIKAAHYDELKHAFETHCQQTEGHVKRLEQVFDELGESPKGKEVSWDGRSNSLGGG